jgi:hypothetical protein
MSEWGEIDDLRRRVQKLEVLEIANLAGVQVLLSDDTATSFKPTFLYGMLIFLSRSAGNTIDGLLAFRVAPTSNRMTILAGGSNLEATTGPLTGTTGTDGKFTISAHTDGKIYMENRRGADRSVCYVVLGS